MFFEKMTKNHFCGGEANATSETPVRSIFFGVFTVFFLAISKRNNSYFHNFDFVQYSSGSQSFIIGFFVIQFLWTNRFLIDKQNVLSIIDNTGLIDEKIEKIDFSPIPSADRFNMVQKLIALRN